MVFFSGTIQIEKAIGNAEIRDLEQLIMLNKIM
jgi:hypothetical protein